MGVVLLIVAGLFHGREPWVTLIRELGAVAVAMGLLSVAWDFGARRAFTEEMLRQLRISQQVAAAGIVGVTPNFNQGIAWEEEFRAAHQVDLFFAYATSWLFEHHQQLSDVARRPGASIRLVLPDPDDSEVVAELAHRFAKTRDAIRRSIGTTEHDVESLAQEPGAVAHVEIWHLPRAPMFTYYRFDDTAILAMYNHSGWQYPVPAVTCGRPGSLFEVLSREFSLMVGGVPGQPAAIGKRVFAVR